MQSHSLGKSSRDKKSLPESLIPVPNSKVFLNVFRLDSELTASATFCLKFARLRNSIERLTRESGAVCKTLEALRQPRDLLQSRGEFEQ